MELFHGADHIRYVFDDVRGSDLAEGAVAEREWEMIQVRDYVGPCMPVPIQAYGAGVLVEAAADVENGKLAYGKGLRCGCLKFGGQRS
jgi:hypothetical protein